MSKSQHPSAAARRAPKAGVAFAISLLSLLVLGLLSPAAHSQTNSPSPGQPSDSSGGPSSGGPSNQTGTNAGGDGQAGNRSTPGQGGATGGGAGAPAGDDSGGAGGIIALVFVGLVILVGAGLLVSGRQRRLERVEAT
jgi:predicted lipid-binding transport protein (Tim44 family)